MKLAIASDHGGFELKESIKQYLLSKGYEVKDFGISSNERCDYPDYGEAAARAVVSKECDKGIVVCGTGIGISIAANKIDGIRCALVCDVFSAKASSAHNNANMIALGERVTGKGLANELVQAWLDTEFEGGRHEIRVNKIMELERK